VDQLKLTVCPCTSRCAFHFYGTTVELNYTHAHIPGDSFEGLGWEWDWGDSRDEATGNCWRDSTNWVQWNVNAQLMKCSPRPATPPAPPSFWCSINRILFSPKLQLLGDQLHCSFDSISAMAAFRNANYSLMCIIKSTAPFSYPYHTIPHPQTKPIPPWGFWVWVISSGDEQQFPGTRHEMVDENGCGACQLPETV